MRILLSKKEWEIYMREVGAQLGKPNANHQIAGTLVPMIQRVLADFGVTVEKEKE